MAHRISRIGLMLAAYALATGAASGVPAITEAPSPALTERLAPPFFPELDRKSAEDVYLAGLAALYPGRLVTELPAEPVPSGRAPLVEDLPRNIRYLRVYDLAAATPELTKNLGQAALIVDLRFVGSTPAAAAAFSRALADGRDDGLVELLGTYPSDTHDSVRGERVQRTSPVFVLVNAKTSGPVEAWLAGLQARGAALLVGTRTAGETGAYERLSPTSPYYVITGEIRPRGGPSLLARGATPDFRVEVSPPEDYRAYFAHETGLALESLLRVGLPKKNGAPTPDDKNHRPPKDETPTADPVLQRAVDLVVALQVLGKLPNSSQPR